MTNEATIRRITQKLGLAIARLNTTSHEAWTEAERDLAEAVLLTSTLLGPSPDPVLSSISKCLDDPNAGA